MNPTEQYIRTTDYAVTSRQYLDVIARIMLGKLWWIFIFPLVLFIIGFFDWRFFVIGLMLIFLIYPFILTMALLNHAMSREVIRRSKSVRTDFNGNAIIIYEAVESEDGNLIYKQIESTHFSDISIEGNKARLIIDGPYNFLLIPLECLPEDLH